MRLKKEAGEPSSLCSGEFYRVSALHLMVS